MIYGSVCSGIEAATQAWHPLGWSASFLSEIEKFPREVLAHHYPNTPLHGDFTTIQKGDYEPIELLVGGTPCQSFSVAGLRAGLNDPRGALMLEFGALAKRFQPNGWFGKTYQVSCPVTVEGISEASSLCWGNSGMGSPTGFLTLNTSEFHKDVDVCSLSDVLVTLEVPQRYFLSATACRGILRRAGVRGKKLPVRLQDALETVALT